MNYSPVCFQSTLLVLVSVSTVIAMFLKTLTFAILAVGVLAKYEELKLIEKYCETNGTVEEAVEIMTALKTCGDCIQEKMQVTREDYQEIYDEAVRTHKKSFRQICAVARRTKPCMYAMTSAITPCIDARDVGTFNTVYDQLLDFMCYKDGERISLYEKEGGPECLEGKRKEIGECFGPLMEGMLSLDVKKLSVEERRAERLSRARRPQYGGKRRRPATRIQKQPKENECFTAHEGTRTSSPPQLDYITGQKPQLCEEPEILDAGALAATVRWTANAARAERTRKDERHAAPRSSRRDQTGPETTLDKITKKISVLKKSIAKYESEYEAQHGHAITPSDRITDVQLTRMYESLKRLQDEKKCIKADPVEYAMKIQAAKLQKERDDKLDAALKSDKAMADVVRDIEEWLEGCRQAAGRSSTPEAHWSSAQLAAEKCCVQRALLRLEAARGRPPAHSVERGAARHLYERYRAVKRALASSRPDAGMMCANGELATIHEHEAMLFNSSVDSSSDSQSQPRHQLSQETTETPLQSPPTKENLAEEVASSTSSAQSGNSGTTSEEATPSNEGLHCLGLEDLSRALSEAKLQKCVLRRSIKEYEISFELQNSRKVQRDDKKGKEEEYFRYKAIKARIKLLNALINKQKALAD